MVARDDIASDARPALASVAAALFLAWRRMLTAALAAVWRSSRALVAHAPRALAVPALLARFAARPASALESDGERRTAAVAGIASLAAGVALSTLLAPALHIPTAEAAIAAFWTLGWAGLRFGILRVTTDLPRGALLHAWAAGLLPSVFGATDVLRVVALAASAWLTLGALEGAGGEVREARRAVAVAFGAEALAALLRWFAGGLLLYWVSVR